MPWWWLANRKRVVGSQAGLNVLEGDVVDVLSACELMIQIGRWSPDLPTPR
jgi:hypothetical protein